MGGIWGISPSVARVHALLLATDRAYSLDELCDELQIVKSNASTSLRELRSWGVVRKVVSSDDRRERYQSESDAWTALFNIARERKRREFDPALSAIRSALGVARTGSSGLARTRLKDLESMLSTLDSVANKALASETAARALLTLVAGR